MLRKSALFGSLAQLGALKPGDEFTLSNPPFSAEDLMQAIQFMQDDKRTELGDKDDVSSGVVHAIEYMGLGRARTGARKFPMLDADELSAYPQGRSLVKKTEGPTSRFSALPRLSRYYAISI